MEQLKEGDVIMVRPNVGTGWLFVLCLPEEIKSKKGVIQKIDEKGLYLNFGVGRIDTELTMTTTVFEGDEHGFRIPLEWLEKAE